MNKPYIIYDEKGDPVNGKYPPNKEMYGEEFNRSPCSQFVLLDKICRNHGGWCDNCMENGACH